MSNSNPQLKQYIREHLMQMLINELQESSAARRAETREIKTRLGWHGRTLDPIINRHKRSVALAAQAKVGKALTTAKAQTAAAATNKIALAGKNAKLTSTAAATPMGKWTAGVKNVDSKLLGNAATPGGAASTKGVMGSGGKIGTAVSARAIGLGAAIQGVSSFSNEWEENKSKGAGTGENIAKSVGRGVAGAAGAGLGTWGGMAAGAAIGSVVPVVGTVIGGAVGALVGGLGGGWLGDKVGDIATNLNDDENAIADFRAEQEIKKDQRKAKIQAARQEAENAKWAPKKDSSLESLKDSSQTDRSQASNNRGPSGQISGTWKGMINYDSEIPPAKKRVP